jgi:hypothetical protein
MVKKVLVIFILMLSITLSQGECDGHCLSDDQVKSLRNSILTLEQSDSTNSAIITNLNDQIGLLNSYISNDSLIISQYKYRLGLKDELIKEIKPKWYDNKYIWYFSGIFSFYLATEAVNNIK